MIYMILLGNRESNINPFYIIMTYFRTKKSAQKAPSTTHARMLTDHSTLSKFTTHAPSFSHG